jgi:CheY-like chemotaxis protein
VLVVEDEHRLRQLMVGQLTGLGYRVLEASNAAAALELLGQHPEVQLLYSDLVMPGGLSGLDLARRVMEAYPQVRVVLTTGYGELTGDIASDINLRVLRKPYRQAELQRMLRDSLDAPHGPSHSGAPRGSD